MKLSLFTLTVFAHTCSLVQIWQNWLVHFFWKMNNFSWMHLRTNYTIDNAGTRVLCFAIVCTLIVTRKSVNLTVRLVLSLRCCLYADCFSRYCSIATLYVVFLPSRAFSWFRIACSYSSVICTILFFPNYLWTANIQKCD